MFRVGALMVAAAAAVAVVSPAHASTLTYDITLTQTYGTLLTGSDFTATGSFTVAAPTSSYEMENISNLKFTIDGKTYTSNATIQFQGLEPIREVWIHGGGFAASRLSMMRIMARRMNAATVVV